MDNFTVTPADMGKPVEQLVKLNKLMPLPAPYDRPGAEPALTDPKPEWRLSHCASLDGYIANDNLKRPQNHREADEMIKSFLSGLEKLFMADTNRNFLQPLTLSFEYCAKCNTCSEACHIYQASGKAEIYRPVFRSETLRMLYRKHKHGGGLVNRFLGGDIDINVESILRLGELAYRCNVCRRCAQTCPLGLDNGLMCREIRKLFSMEMGIAPKALHEGGTIKHLETGSSTGMTEKAFLNIIEFIEDDLAERLGKKFKIPVNKKGADVLLLHNAGEFISWPENPAAFAVIFEEAGINWTLSSEYMGYDIVNYGLFYDDVQTRKIGMAQLKTAKELGVRRMIVGECGHAHRATAFAVDRAVVGDDIIPKESFLPLLWEIVRSRAIDLDPWRNDFPVTLHDPCNMARMMGIVRPQRQIIKAIAPQFREMVPNGARNYCCGGGSGFAIFGNHNFSEFRNKVASRMKFKQILEAFPECAADRETVKYVCAPCSNCKGAMRSIFEHYEATDEYNFQYGGLVDLVVNAMPFERPFLEFLEEEAYSLA